MRVLRFRRLRSRPASRVGRNWPCRTVPPSSPGTGTGYRVGAEPSRARKGPLSERNLTPRTMRLGSSNFQHAAPPVDVAPFDMRPLRWPQTRCGGEPDRSRSSGVQLARDAVDLGCGEHSHGARFRLRIRRRGLRGVPAHVAVAHPCLARLPERGHHRVTEPLGQARREACDLVCHVLDVGDLGRPELLERTIGLPSRFTVPQSLCWRGFAAFRPDFWRK